MGGDLDPFAAAGDDRKHRGLGIDHPHVVLQLRHVFLGRGFFGERPGQHELGFKHRPAAFHQAVKCRRHPPNDRMLNLPLDVFDDVAGIALDTSAG